MDSNYSSPHLLNASASSAISGNATFDYMVLSKGAKTFIMALHALIFLVGITGNLTVIYFFGIKKKVLRVFDINVISLAAADLLLSSFSPVVTIHDLVTNLETWKLMGGFGCKLFVSIDHVTMLVSAAMLVIISSDRLRYMRADRRVSVPLRGTYTKICVAWVLSICVVAPYTNSLTFTNNVCAPKWSSFDYYTYYIVYVSLSCIIPANVLIIIQARIAYILSSKIVITTTTQGKADQCEFRRLSKIAVLISVMYFLLTMPYAIIHFLASYFGTFKLDIYLQYRETFETLIYVFHTISHCNCFINPFIYAGMQRRK